MKITALYGAMPANDYGLIKIKESVYQTLEELGVKPDEISLFYSSLPFFDGIKSDVLTPIVNAIKESDGVIIATTANFSLPNALVVTLFEHLKLSDFKDAFWGKNCLLILCCNDGTLNQAMYSLSSALNGLGANDSVRIAADDYYAGNLELNPNFKETLERQVEDYYRLLRQQRRFYIPALTTSIQDSGVPTGQDTPVFETKKIIDQVKQDKFNERQMQDIQEITSFFSQKINAAAEKAEGFAPESPAAPAVTQPAAPRLQPEPDPAPQKNCRQLTASLVHYFQPQLSGGLNAVIQLSISGDEAFEGFIQIDNLDCSYKDGTAQNPDITVLTTSQVWENVITGKITAQKAFMIGQLKVRGNFALLTRFDQLFKTDKIVK